MDPKDDKFRSIIFFIVIPILCIVAIIFAVTNPDKPGAMAALIVFPFIMLALFLSRYFEKRSEKKINTQRQGMRDGSYYNNDKWANKYQNYRNKNSFERAVKRTMKEDLLYRFRRGSLLFSLIMSIVAMIACIITLSLYVYESGYIAFGIIICGFWMAYAFSMYFGFPVRKWAKEIGNNIGIESSYMNSYMLSYQANFVALGTTHFHGFAGSSIFVFDYRNIDYFKKSVVFEKNYTNSIYSGERTKFFLKIILKPSNRYSIREASFELNEFQLEMFLEKAASMMPEKVVMAAT